MLWTRPETARQLRVSTRQVDRLLAQGVLPCVRIGRAVRIPRQAVENYVRRLAEIGQNGPSVEPAVRGGTNACHIDAKTVPSGGRVSSTHAEKELDALLEQRTEGRRKRSKRDGNTRRTGRNNGTSRNQGRSTS
ncbi:MAG: helix-turn-helix domain-containing protein [Gammaproteobacteria bacterium]|nr:helix-turn-helix domain-containing protein [Gammaproteobacteria bacterium]